MPLGLFGFTENTMIRVAIMYPNKPGNKFNFKYYRSSHLNLVKEKYTPYGLKRIELDEAKVLEGPQKAPYFAIGYLVFNSSKEFLTAIKEAGEEVMADVENFTNTHQVVQVSQFSIL